ncbi:MAG: ATP-binding protein [Deltaproteobacteria bacterium]|nr:ATP-binding protein [Deltaproteobacteria bacterium]MBW2122783.1 ATP-binding protein [Deltaproteobacteria bacterium]
MKQLTIISGKGGTGKTTITAAFALLARRKVMADCDVDAADLHLLLNPELRQTVEFYGGRSPVVDQEKCTRCGICTDLCRFDAIKDGVVDLVSCDHCGLCVYGCPEDAITMRENHSGSWFVSETAYGLLVHARLGIGEENSGKLVTAVRKKASEIAENEGLDLVIIDGPPGVGCPVMASVAGVDMILSISEPTLSGMHDLNRVLDLAGHFKIPARVCINKFDINPEITAEIERECRDKGVEVVSKLPFDRCVVDSLVMRKTVIQHPCGEFTSRIRDMWERIEADLS